MAYSEQDLTEALDAIVARLIAQTALAAPNAFIAYAQPGENPINPATSGGLYALVYPVSGDFDQGKLDGRGTVQATMIAQVIVRLTSTAELDQQSRADQWLTHATQGLLPLLRTTLKALTVHDLVDSGGGTFLREPMRPISMAFIPDEQSVEITFEVIFDWDLTS